MTLDNESYMYMLGYIILWYGGLENNSVPFLKWPYIFTRGSTFLVIRKIIVTIDR